MAFRLARNGVKGDGEVVRNRRKSGGANHQHAPRGFVAAKRDRQDHD